MWYLMWCGFGVGKVEPPISKFKNWMREKFILNIYKNDEWAPLWAAEDKVQRVHAMMVYSYKLQWHLNVACRGVKIGDFWLKQGKTKEEWTVSAKIGIVTVHLLWSPTVCFPSFGKKFKNGFLKGMVRL